MPVMSPKHMTVEEFRAEGERLFGPDEMLWCWKCPSCGHVASTQDYKDAGATSSAVGFSCVGRWTGATQDAFADGPGPCNYAGGGLIGINPIAVKDGETTHRIFEFAAKP